MKTLKNEICLECIWPETWIVFLALKNIHFLRVLGKSLRNNAPSTILPNTPSWYFLQYHQRYSPQYPTHTTHVNTPPTLSTLAHHPRQPCWYVTLARRPRNPRWHVTHAGTSPTLARHQHKHTTHASAPPTAPTLAQIARHFSNPWVSN